LYLYQLFEPALQAGLGGFGGQAGALRNLNNDQSGGLKSIQGIGGQAGLGGLIRGQPYQQQREEPRPMLYNLEQRHNVNYRKYQDGQLVRRKKPTKSKPAQKRRQEME
jgi:hypothetical protein